MKKKSMSKSIVFSIASILLFVYCVVILFFFVYGFLISIKEDMWAFTEDQINTRLFSLPKGFKGFKNYITAFTVWERVLGVDYYMLVWNSLWQTVIPQTVVMLMCAMVTYILVFYRSKMTRMIYNIGLIVVTVPLFGSGAGTYRLMYNLGLIDNPLHYLSAISLFGGPFFFMYAFWKSLSWQYAEAGKIDGASDNTVFFKIMLPMLLPSASALYIMNLIGAWNSYSNIIVYMQSYPTLSYAIYAYGELAKYDANIPAFMAGVLLTMLPALIIYVVFQDSIMTKVYLGGLKG